MAAHTRSRRVLPSLNMQSLKSSELEDCFCKGKLTGMYSNAGRFYLLLQGCILFLAFQSSDKSGALLSLPCSHKMPYSYVRGVGRVPIHTLGPWLTLGSKIAT